MAGDGGSDEHEHQRQQDEDGHPQRQTDSTGGLSITSTLRDVEGDIDVVMIDDMAPELLQTVKDI